MTADLSYFAGERGTPERVRCFLHPKSAVYFLEWRAGGRKLRRSTGTRDRDVAKSAADAKATELRSTVQCLAPPGTFAALAEEWLDWWRRQARTWPKPPSPGYEAGLARTLATARRILRTDCLRLDRLAIEHLERYVTERATEGNRNAGKAKGRPIGYATLRHEAKVLKQIMRWARKRRRIAVDPWEDFQVGGAAAAKRYAPRQPSVTPTQYEALLAAADCFRPAWRAAMCRALLTLCFETGRRVGAVRQLCWNDVDEAERRARWRGETDKNGRELWTPLTDEALEALRAWRQVRPGLGAAPVFMGIHNEAEPLPEGTLWNWWRRLEKEAGMPHEVHAGWHSVRRRAATDLMDAPVKAAAELLGNSPAVLTSRYQHPDRRQLEEALAKRRRGA